jgi:hypothetical protein
MRIADSTAPRGDGRTATAGRVPPRAIAAGALVLAGLVLGLSGAGAQQAPKFFPDDPLWIEPITSVETVARYEPGLFYDSLENTFAKPGDKDMNRRAQNVNTVDEVMDGPWFTNRAGTRPLTPEDVARGSNVSGGPPPGKWTVVSAKSDGVTPGFTIRDSNRDLWFVKFDPPGYEGMATGTEVVAAKLFWALGYHTVEYYITRLRPENLEIAESTSFTYPGGKPRRMHEGDIRWLLKKADRDASGGYRVIVSKAAPGRPVGRILIHGRRTDDPNDLVPHENRRELRGYRVFAAWLNHVDAKSINSLDVMVTEGGKSYIRHYLLDFGSALGSAAVAPRDYFEGYETLIEPPKEIGKRALSFGFRIPRWRTVDFYTSPAIGRLPADHTDWDPDLWTPRFPNAAFLRARGDDKFWAARKVQGITPEMIAAAVREGQFTDKTAAEFLAKAINDRRKMILGRYLPAVNPVVDVSLDSPGTLSFANAAVQAGVAQAPGEYLVTWSSFDNASSTAMEIGQTQGGDRQAAPAGLPAASGSYVRVAIGAGAGAPEAWKRPAHAFFRRDTAGWTLVGFERMPE